MTTKKYVSLDKLGTYHEKLTAKIAADDTATLDAAKAYSDSKANQYDAAGSAATAQTNAEANAKTYTDTQIGSVNEVAAGIKTTAEKGVSDAASAKTAADNAQSTADANKTSIDNLKNYVGTIPETATATDVIGYINEKTSGIATDAALGELQASVTQLGKDIDAVEADYLKKADKDELQGNIDAVDALIDTLVGTDTGKSARTIANEELAKQLIAEGAQESLDTLAEIAAWIQSHPGDAAAMNEAITALENLVGTIPEGVTATTIVGYIAEAVAAEKTRAEQKENELSGKIATLEGKFTGEGSVESQIATAKSEAISTAAADATTKADKALADAKKYADDEDAKIEATVTTLTETVGTKASQADLTTLAGRVTTAEGKVSTLETEMDTVEALAAANKLAHEANAAAIALKASQTDLDAVSGRVTTLENWHQNFVECSQEDINLLF